MAKNFTKLIAATQHIYTDACDEEKYTQLDKMKFLQSLKLQFHTVMYATPVSFVASAIP